MILHLGDIDAAVADREPILPGWVLMPLRNGVPVDKWGAIATQTVDDRADLARRWHDGWAVVTGPSALYVIDLDRHVEGIDGVTTYADLIAPLKAPPVRTHTPRDGWHLFYSPPEHRGSITGVLPGVDTKGVGGMATIAGPGRRLFIDAWEFPPVPDAFGTVLAARAEERARRCVEALERRERAGQANWTDKRFAAVLDRIANAVEGTRHNLVVWGSFRGLEAIDSGMDPDEVGTAIIDAGLVAGLTEREAAAPVRHILRGHHAT